MTFWKEKIQELGGDYLLLGKCTRKPFLELRQSYLRVQKSN
jgi:hypothetical protein